MNIFLLDTDIKLSAQQHANKHVVKMRIEYAQILCTVHHLIGSNEVPYKPTHTGHPCVKWVLESISNYDLVLEMANELCKEMVYRFSTPEQKIIPVLRWLTGNKPDIPNKGLTKLKLAMPENCIINENRNLEESVLNYRNYYLKDKTHLFDWGKRGTPHWIN